MEWSHSSADRQFNIAVAKHCFRHTRAHCVLPCHQSEVLPTRCTWGAANTLSMYILWGAANTLYMYILCSFECVKEVATRGQLCRFQDVARFTYRQLVSRRSPATNVWPMTNTWVLDMNQSLNGTDLRPTLVSCTLFNRFSPLCPNIYESQRGFLE